MAVDDRSDPSFFDRTKDIALVPIWHKIAYPSSFFIRRSGITKR